MKHWYMLTVVGADQAGIVAAMTEALFRGGANLGEASMVRLGGNFTIMLMVESVSGSASLRAMLEGAINKFNLHVHIDEIKAQLHQHPEPNVQVVVHGADRAGIVADVTAVLARAGLNILELESEVGGSEAQPLYIMLLQGYVAGGAAALEPLLADVRKSGVEVQITSIDTLIG
jgi:glycine cleavage system transcriptional repressor